MSVNEKVSKAIEIAKKNGIHNDPEDKFSYSVNGNSVEFLNSCGVYCVINIKSGKVAD